MLQHAVLRLGEVCSEVIVVLAPETPEPPMPIGAPARFARDPTEGEGPLAGVHAGLLALGTELGLVTGGDMPDLQTRVLLEMLQVAQEAEVEAYRSGLLDPNEKRRFEFREYIGNTEGAGEWTDWSAS